jgi:hypothetical protein
VRQEASKSACLPCRRACDHVLSMYKHTHTHTRTHARTHARTHTHIPTRSVSLLARILSAAWVVGAGPPAAAVAGRLLRGRAFCVLSIYIYICIHIYAGYICFYRNILQATARASNRDSGDRECERRRRAFTSRALRPGHVQAGPVSMLVSVFGCLCVYARGNRRHPASGCSAQQTASAFSLSRLHAEIGRPCPSRRPGLRSMHGLGEREERIRRDSESRLAPVWMPTQFIDASSER